MTSKEFVQQLHDSGLLPRTEVKDLLDSLPPDSRPKDIKNLAHELVRHEKLTAYQAKEAYAGKARSLVLGNYVILDEIGHGGMGLVLKARHRRMERIVALKILSPKAVATPETEQRFMREVKAVAKLDHQNIVAAYDADEAAGTHFLVMQYVDGQDLEVLVKEHRRLPLSPAIDYILQAAQGLEYAHAQGVVHRDIKPSNLLRDRSGCVKVLDMGLARFEQDPADTLTKTGMVMGTIDFMAPEQAKDSKAADARSDIYSLGATFWFLLTGRPMFEGDTIVEKLLAQQTAPVPSLCEACPAVSSDLEDIWRKMVARSPDDRYPTVSAFISEFKSVATSVEDSSTVATADRDGEEDSSTFLGSSFPSSSTDPTGASESTIKVAEAAVDTDTAVENETASEEQVEPEQPIPPTADGGSDAIVQSEPTNGTSKTRVWIAAAAIFMIGGCGLFGFMVPTLRELGRRERRSNQLKNIGIALNNYEAMYRYFPSAVSAKESGEEIFGWRFSLSPFVQGENAWDNFDHEQKWDSAANRPLIEQVPEAFQSPYAEPGYTNVFAVVCDENDFPQDRKGGPYSRGGFFSPAPNERHRVADINDGLANTLAAIDLPNRSVEWSSTKNLTPSEAFSAIGALKDDQVAFILMADDFVIPVKNDLDRDTFDALLTRDGNDIVDLPFEE